MKKLVCVLLSYILLVCSSGITLVSAATSDSYLSFGSPEAMAEYIEDNLDEVKKQYNDKNSSVIPDMLIFAADYCENKFLVPLINSEEYVVCMDFNGVNGFMVVSNNAILRLETCGSLDYLYEYDGDVYFSSLDNDFVYYEEGEFLLFGGDEDETIIPESYAGTQSNGIITSKYSYLQDRYGDSIVDSYDSLNNAYISTITQDTCSVYTRNGHTEGNCALVAIFNALTYMRNAGYYSSLPAASSMSTVIPQNDYFFNSAIQNNYSVYRTSVPALYYQIRQLAISSYGYTVLNGIQPDGSASASVVGSDTTVGFLKTIGTYYGHNIIATKKETTLSNIAQQIESGKPVLWYTVGDAIYGNHAVVVTGYSVHKQYGTILGIKYCTNTINMLQISNGWNNGSVYYDLEATSGRIFVFN